MQDDSRDRFWGLQHGTLTCREPVQGVFVAEYSGECTGRWGGGRSQAVINRPDGLDVDRVPSVSHCLAAARSALLDMLSSLDADARSIADPQGWELP